MSANNSILEKDLVQVKTILERMDTSVEKLTIISHDVTQLLAVHENRLTYQERTNDQMRQQLDDRKKESEDLRQTIHDKVESIKDDFHDLVGDQKKEILTKLDDANKKQEEQHEEIKQRMSKLERWMWSLCGGGAVVVFILEKFPNILN